jgi:phosphotransferase system  glucose/maltose/N-acetylglucosamine-specific IIC component
MDSTQLNLMVIVAVLAAAGVFAIIVAALSSRTLRDEGLKNLVKRWLR